MALQLFFRRGVMPRAAVERMRLSASRRLDIPITGLDVEHCFYVDASTGMPTEQVEGLKWVLRETFDQGGLAETSFLHSSLILEVGPRSNFKPAWSTTALAGLRDCGLTAVDDIRMSTRFGLNGLPAEMADDFLSPLHDSMTEMRYETPLVTFDCLKKPNPVVTIPIHKNGIEALRQFNREQGLGLEDGALQKWFSFFIEKLQRDPTDLEMAHIGVRSADHSVHGKWNAKLIIDGEPMPYSLMETIKQPWKKDHGKALLAFCDNISAVEGFETWQIVPLTPGQATSYTVVLDTVHFTWTIESHCHPSAIEPYNGSGTGTGGRKRDTNAGGRASLGGYGGDIYGVDLLHIPDYEMPWEKNDRWRNAPHFKSPLEILLRAIQGANDHDNPFGEPNLLREVYAYGLTFNGDRYGYFKPKIMSFGGGRIAESQLKKQPVPKNTKLVALGEGLNYCIGVNGGINSSAFGGTGAIAKDWASVQRMDGLAAQKAYRVIQECAALGVKNPIKSIHDRGAGGNCSVFTELADILGAKISLRDFPLGDPSLSDLEIWINESQDIFGVAVDDEGWSVLKGIADHEQTGCVIIGEVTGDGQLILYDKNTNATPLCLPVKEVTEIAEGKKMLTWERKQVTLLPLNIPELSLREHLDLVLRLLGVCSAHFATVGSDHSVTGRPAKSMQEGPNALPTCKFGLLASGFFGVEGMAGAVGSHPLLSFISPKAMARMSTARALLRLAAAGIEDLKGVNLHANWLSPMSLPGEGPKLYDAVEAENNFLTALGIRVVAGKDSSSFGAKAINPEGELAMVKGILTSIISAYASVEDITVRVSPSFKKAGNYLMAFDFSQDKYPLGGSSLAYVHGQIGDDCPDVAADDLKKGIVFISRLIKEKLIVAYAPKSNGGLIATVLEMAFAGNLGVKLDLYEITFWLNFLFSENAGVVVECNPQNLARIYQLMQEHGILGGRIGLVLPVENGDAKIYVSSHDHCLLDDSMLELRALWQETSDRLQLVDHVGQPDPVCVASEIAVNRRLITPPPVRFDFSKFPGKWAFTPDEWNNLKYKPKVMIFSPVGGNGGDEMTALAIKAGFDPVRVMPGDLVSGKIPSLDIFRSIWGMGGWADGDEFGAGKLAAARIRLRPKIKAMFDKFRDREDTFSYWVCNGFQIATMLGWLPFADLPDEQQPRLLQNPSLRFDSRIVTVKILPSNSIMLKDLEYSTLQLHSAHGEGRVYFPDESILQRVLNENLAPVRYVNDLGEITDAYPFCPNGSPHGIAGFCSPNGRDWAGMPHWDRTYMRWNLSHWWPEDWPKDRLETPAILPFRNAYRWCEETEPVGVI